jgi:hypothetical protein
MKSNWRAFALAVIAAGFCLGQSTTAEAGCVGSVQEFKASKRIRNVRISPMRPKPQPYWRSSVSPDLYQKPDVVTSKTHTVCWSGVVSPTVCSTGARVCW